MKKGESEQQQQSQVIGLINKLLEEPLQHINSLNQIIPGLIALFQEGDENQQIQAIDFTN